MDDEIRGEITRCRHHVQALIIIKDNRDAQTWFKEICQILTNLLICVRRHVRKFEDSQRKNFSTSTSFYFSQLTTYLSLLIPAISQKITETTDVRYYIQKQLLLCLDGVESIIDSRSINACSDENFMIQIDSSLDKLSIIDPNQGKLEALNKYHNAHQQIEQALCHAMSIAHVGFSQDFQAIKGSCKSVLTALDSLHKELQKAELNIAMCNLSIDSCYDKLCHLERSVNITVLTLCLKIFSQYKQPLDLLCKCCEQSVDSNEEIDELTVKFDLQVDRIMQIGIFAIASSPDTLCSVKMQSHLACLEALESELVPNLKTLILDKSPRNVCLISILKGHWLKEVEGLKCSLYSVIDPFAFGQITLEEVKQLTDAAFENTTNTERESKLTSLQLIITETEALIHVITTSFGDAKPPTKVRNLLTDLKRVLYETKAAIHILLVENELGKDNSPRLKKRCKIMLSIIKKLVLSLAEENHPNDLTIKNEQSHSKNESSHIKQSEDDNDNKFLNHIINKGKEILKERKTPMKVTFFTGFHKPPILALNSFHFSYSKVRNEDSIDLQLTEILSDLKSTSNSFNNISSNSIDY